MTAIETDKLIDNSLARIYNVRYSINSTYGLCFITPDQFSGLRDAISILRHAGELDGMACRIILSIFKHHYDNFYKIKKFDAAQPRVIAQKFIGKKNVRQFIIKRDGRCLRCGRVDKLTIDHINPISKGGENKIGNLQTLCKSCNSIKKDSFIDYRNIKPQTQRNKYV